MPRRSLAFLSLLALAASAAPTGCGDDELGSSGTQTTGTQTTGTQTTGTGGAGGAGGGTGGAGGIPGDLLCPTTFTFTAPQGAFNVRIPGEWNGFDLASAPQMTGPTGAGVYTATIDLPPGLLAYKLAYDL